MLTFWQHTIMQARELYGDMHRRAFGEACFYLQVPYMIMICMRRQALPEKVMPEWEEMCAVSSAVQNLWLAATAHGVAGAHVHRLGHAP